MSFDPIQYKATTRRQWEDTAEAWDRREPVLEAWLGEATRQMLEAAGIRAGTEVLDVAAGAGGQTLAAARRVGPAGRVVATDISPTILTFAAKAAAQAGLTNVETLEADGEALGALAGGGFDAVISRLGLIYFPDQHRALTGMARVLRDGGRAAAIVYSTADRNQFFSIPVSIIRDRAKLPPPQPGQPGPFSRPASCRPLSRPPGSGRSPSTPCPPRCGLPRRPSVSGSNGNPSEPCTRCSPPCPSTSGTGCGLTSKLSSPSSKHQTGSPARASCTSPQGRSDRPGACTRRRGKAAPGAAEQLPIRTTAPGGAGQRRSRRAGTCPPPASHRPPDIAVLSPTRTGRGNRTISGERQNRYSADPTTLASTVPK